MKLQVMITTVVDSHVMCSNQARTTKSEVRVTLEVLIGGPRSGVIVGRSTPPFPTYRQAIGLVAPHRPHTIRYLKHKHPTE